MLTKLTLENFKNFKRAEILLGPMTTVIGTNASGKSNLRDAFRFLHGIGRGYPLAEIMGEKYGEGGELQWKGIRGGIREAAYLRADHFSLKIELVYEEQEKSLPMTYFLKVRLENGEKTPRIIEESLYAGDHMIFDSHPSQNAPLQKNPESIYVRILQNLGIEKDKTKEFSSYRSALSQYYDYSPNLFKQQLNLLEQDIINDLHPDVGRVFFIAFIVLLEFYSIRFFEFYPQAMRFPSFPGQTILGDRGENLTSVLQAICEDPQQKKALLEWIRELTPMDVVDFEFPADQTGKILLSLVEGNGNKISAYSASDGTLRFLAIIAALLGPKPAKLLFFEELENGLHPSRLHLLLQLMERKASEGNIQIINTTHSPQFLRFLSQESLQHASLTYRLPDSAEGRIKRLIDISDVQRLIEEQDIANLHESGWFENALFLDETEEVAE